MDIIYGIQVDDVSNEHVVQAETWVAGVNQVIEPGRFLVDILPFCRLNLLFLLSVFIFFFSAVCANLVPRGKFQTAPLWLERKYVQCTQWTFQGSKGCLRMSSSHSSINSDIPLSKVTGTSKNCVVTKILESISDKSDRAEREHISRDSLGSAFGGMLDEVSSLTRLLH